jgi:hypothetical protein
MWASVVRFSRLLFAALALGACTHRDLDLGDTTRTRDGGNTATDGGTSAAVLCTSQLMLLADDLVDPVVVTQNGAPYFVTNDGLATIDGGGEHVVVKTHDDLLGFGASYGHVYFNVDPSGVHVYDVATGKHSTVHSEDFTFGLVMTSTDWVIQAIDHLQQIDLSTGDSIDVPIPDVSDPSEVLNLLGTRVVFEGVLGGSPGTGFGVIEYDPSTQAFTSFQPPNMDGVAIVVTQGSELGVFDGNDQVVLYQDQTPTQTITLPNAMSQPSFAFDAQAIYSLALTNGDLSLAITPRNGQPSSTLAVQTNVEPGDSPVVYTDGSGVVYVVAQAGGDANLSFKLYCVAPVV